MRVLKPCAGAFALVPVWIAAQFQDVLVILLLLAFKIVPVYMEYFAIRNHFKALAADPNLRNANRRQVASAFAARATVDDLTAIGPDQVEVTKGADGIIVSAEYEKKVPLFRNVSACFEFRRTIRTSCTISTWIAMCVGVCTICFRLL